MKFDWLISPILRSEFISDYLDQKHLFVKRGYGSAYDNFFQIDDIENILSFGNLRTADFRIFRNGRAVDPSAYSSDHNAAPHLRRIKPYLVAQEIARGGTLIFEGAHRYHKGLHEFCRSLEIDTGQRFQANIYVTPAECEGFQPHFDGHDVFVCQISGTKRWKVARKICDRHRVSSQRAGSFELCFSDDIDQLELFAGDLLYIPRGQIHSAKSTEVTSIHITIGMVSTTWSDYLKTAIDLAASNHSLLNDTVPLWNSREVSAASLETVRSRIFNISQDVPHSEVIQQICRSRSENSHAEIQFPVSVPVDIDENTKCEINSNILYTIQFDDERLRIEFHGIAISLPLKTQAVIEFIIEQSSVSINELLTFMDVNSATNLVTRLINEGFLRELR